MKIKVQPNPNQSFQDDIIRPAGVKEYTGEINGFTRTWKEYIPKSYDGSKAVPLVLSCHGGAQHSAEYRFAWEIVAEREGFIVLYPQCLVNGITWNVWNDYSEADGMPNDIAYIDALIDMLCEKYKIDTTRIYIQGQSMGDMMTSTYICSRSNRIAAAAPLSGPNAALRYFNADGTRAHTPPTNLPVIRTHGSEDLGCPVGKQKLPNLAILKQRKIVKRQMPPRPEPKPIPDGVRQRKMEVQLLVNDAYWKGVNETVDLPEINVYGPYAEFRYPGPESDYVLYCVNGGQHVLSSDMADNIWTYFFTKYRRIDGKIVRVEPEKSLKPNRGAIALADQASLAYVDNKLMEVGGDVILKAVELNGVYYVPAEFLSRAFPGMTVTYDDGGTSAEFAYGENRLQVAAGMGLSVFNDYMVTLNRSRFIDNCLYVPIGDIAKKFFGWNMVTGRGAAYIYEGDLEMSFDLAYHIRRLLGTEDIITPVDSYRMEQEIMATGVTDGSAAQL